MLWRPCFITTCVECAVLKCSDEAVLCGEEDGVEWVREVVLSF